MSDPATDIVRANNLASLDAAESDTEIAALQATVDSLPSFVTGPAPHNQVEVVPDGDEVYGKLAGVPRVLAVDSGVSVTSTASETTLLTAAGIITPVANVIAAADQLTFFAYGTVVNNSGSDQTFRWRVDIGGTDVVDFTALTLPSHASPRQWEMKVEARATSTSGGQFARVQARLSVSAGGGGDLTLNKFLAGTSVVTSFSSPSAWDLTITHGSSASSSLTSCQQARLTRLRLGS